MVLLVLSDNLLVIGVDGGGTKTESVLLDGLGVVRGDGKGGSVNRTFVGQEVVDKSLDDAFSGVFSHLENSDDVSAVGVCLISGWRQALEWTRNAGFSGSFYMFSETVTAFRRAGLLHSRGIAVIAGTGSGFRYFDGERSGDSLGGWGAGVGDEGSAFDIGLQAIKAAGRSQDGRGPKTVLFDKLLERAEAHHFGQILSKYCWPALKQRDIAQLSKLVSIAAGEGDEVAIEILTSTGQGLGQDTVHMARRVFGADEEFAVAYSGGVFNAGQLITDPLEAVVRSEFPRAQFYMPNMSAGEAVAHLTLERFRLC